MNRLIINKLIIQGAAYRRTIEFDKKLTIISGEKTSGKSLILSLIDYSFGKKSKIDFNVQPELEAMCDQVFLEININDELLTLNRGLKEKHTNISIYYCSFNNIDEYTPKTLSIPDAMKVLMHKLNINEYKLIRNKKHSNKKEIDTVSFRDVFRYVYIHQHQLGTGDFLDKKSPFKSNKNPHAFKMMFNLIDADKDTLKEQLVNIQNEIEETKREIYGLNSYLRDLDAMNQIELQAKSTKLEKVIEEHKNSRITILENNRNNSHRNYENKMYIKLKNELSGITDEIDSIQVNKRQLQLSISSKKLLLKEYFIEKKDIEETLELNYKLIIPEQNIECPLCSSKVSSHLHNKEHYNKNTETSLNTINKQILNKIILVEDLIKKESKNIDDLESEITMLTKKKAIYNKAIIEYSKSTDVPYLSQINTINVMMNNTIKNQEILKEGLRLHNKINEKNNSISDLRATELRLSKKLDALNVREDYKEEVFEFLNQEYKGFMERLKYDTTQGSYIHEEQMIPYYNDASVYAHESGGLLECMQLSFLGAILKSKDEGYATGHPGLLILDSLSKYVGTLKQDEEKLKNSSRQKEKINDPEVYEEFYKILIELCENHQIILVENTPPDQYDSLYTKYTFYTGEKGLINEVENEVNELNFSFEE